MEDRIATELSLESEGRMPEDGGRILLDVKMGLPHGSPIFMWHREDSNAKERREQIANANAQGCAFSDWAMPGIRGQDARG